MISDSYSLGRSGAKFHESMSKLRSSDKKWPFFTQSVYFPSIFPCLRTQKSNMTAKFVIFRKNSLERKDKAILPSIKLTFGSSSIVILNLDLWTLAPRTGYARGARIWTQKLLYLKITVNYWQATSIKNDFNNLILFY